MRTSTLIAAPLFTLIALTLLTSTASAQYNRSAGRSMAPAAEQVRVERKDDSGKVTYDYEEREVARDAYGNAADSSYDLAVDGAFEGQTIVVVQLYNFDFSQARDALKRKGFSVYRFNGTPKPEELTEALKKANQLWVISNCSTSTTLTEAHLKPIKAFFDAGHGLYIWGDNDPCYGDANYVSNYVLDASMSGNTPGDQTIMLKRKESDTSGILANHLLSTGVESIYEGITIATIKPNKHMTPFIWGSAGNLVASFYDYKGKRAILDGGFTRLYYKWDTAGTGRYVVNAAAWLANYERFGDKVVAKPSDAKPKIALEGDAPGGATAPLTTPPPKTPNRTLSPRTR